MKVSKKTDTSMVRQVSAKLYMQEYMSMIRLSKLLKETVFEFNRTAILQRIEKLEKEYGGVDYER